MSLKRLALIFKRLIDIILSSFLIVIFFPLILFLVFFVRLSIGSPIFFLQKRPGIDNTTFNMIKFRTMIEQPKNAKLSDEERLTKFGKWMRRFSLDELPQLFNVLKGEMSLVGPRPLLLEYLTHFTPKQRRRQNMLPGITGWCQINGRNDLPWEKKLELDVWYIENWNLWLDLKILFKTPWVVFVGKGVNKKGHATTDKFYK